MRKKIDHPSVVVTNFYGPRGMPEDEAGPAAWTVEYDGFRYAGDMAKNFPKIQTYLLTDRTFPLADRVKLAASLLCDAQDIEETAEKFTSILKMEVCDVSKMTAAEIISHSKALIEQNEEGQTDVIIWPVRELLGLSAPSACRALTEGAFGYPCYCAGLKSA